MAKSKKAKINLKPKEKRKSFVVGNEVLILRIGVIVLALIIFGLWIFIQSNSWRSNQDLVDISELQEILDESVPSYDDNEIVTGEKKKEMDDEEAIEEKA